MSKTATASLQSQSRIGVMLLTSLQSDRSSDAMLQDWNLREESDKRNLIDRSFKSQCASKPQKWFWTESFILG